VLKFSIITVVYNRVDMIANTLHSIQSQNYKNYEHIIIDGASVDGTLEILKKYEADNDNVVLVSEKDEGIYDALNKGIRCAKGDVIGVIHSDDIYAYDAVLTDVATELADPEVDAVYADAVFYREENPDNEVRRYSSRRFSPDKLAWGWMPAHTTLFLRKKVFEQFGFYKTDYKIAADFEFIARIFKSGQIQSVYLPKVLLRMAIGGVSTAGFKNTIRLNQEVLRACRENQIKTNIFKILSKYPLKILEFVKP